MTDADHARLLVEVSRDYYLDNRSKVDIASTRGISRFQVARLLAEARESGVVRIEISPPASLDGDRATALARRLGTRDVVIVPSAADPRSTRDSAARAIARELAARIRSGMTVGVSWSRTIEIAVGLLEALPPCEVVQLVGALSVAGAGDSLALIERFRGIPGVSTRPVWSPMLVGDPATAAGMRRQPEIAAALDRADHLDLAVVAVGAWSANGSTVYPLVSEEDRRAATTAGTVAECSGRLLDAAGRPVTTELDARVVGVTVDQLARTAEVVAVGYGAHTAPALRAAVAGIGVTTLVCDEAAAAALEELLEPATA